MATKLKQPKVLIHGLQDRAAKNIKAFLSGPCLNAAEVVENGGVDIDIFDLDVIASNRILKQHLEDGLIRPAIVMSVAEFEHEGAIHVKKPVSVDGMLHALAEAQKIAAKVSKITVGLVNPSLAKHTSSLKTGAAESGLETMDSTGKTPENSNSADQLQAICDWFDKALDNSRPAHG